VLDASSLLALLHGERGAETVEPLVEGSAISTVNWSEVHQRSIARGVDVMGLRGDVEALGVELVPFDAEDAERAAEYWPVTRDTGLSLGDRACLALAFRLGLPAVTADRAWAELDLGVQVQAIR
jgi:PIN domain nuclease of toxin-antitoxin system